MDGMRELLRMEAAGSAAILPGACGLISPSPYVEMIRARLCLVAHISFMGIKKKRMLSHPPLQVCVYHFSLYSKRKNMPCLCTRRR